MHADKPFGFTIRRYNNSDLPALTGIWNRVVLDGAAFPQEKPLSLKEAEVFFAAQDFTAAAVENETNKVIGLYILHPNNVGRCGHICNASYAVDAQLRGTGIGHALVEHSLAKGRELGFKIMQFNAVVASNSVAIHIYEELGFVRLGIVPGGFRTDSGYADIILFYHTL